MAINTLRLGKMHAILQTIFWNVFSWTKWLYFHWKCTTARAQTSNFQSISDGSGNGWVINRRQVISRAKADQNIWCHMASPGQKVSFTEWYVGLICLLTTLVAYNIIEPIVIHSCRLVFHMWHNFSYLKTIKGHYNEYLFPLYGKIIVSRVSINYASRDLFQQPDMWWYPRRLYVTTCNHVVYPSKSITPQSLISLPIAWLIWFITPSWRCLSFVPNSMYVDFILSLMYTCIDHSFTWSYLFLVELKNFHSYSSVPYRITIYYMLSMVAIYHNQSNKVFKSSMRQNVYEYIIYRRHHLKIDERRASNESLSNCTHPYDAASDTVNLCK